MGKKVQCIESIWYVHPLEIIILILHFVIVTPQIRDVTGQRQTYTYASEALTY